jgi:hypothetical protein
MEREFHYETVSEAIEQLQKKGFTIDFNLEENSLVFHPEKYRAADFEIVDVYRYEGDSDPGDEATVYALASKSGVKGLLVAGYGASSDPTTTEILKKLRNRTS